jgi:hypothetical protein
MNTLTLPIYLNQKYVFDLLAIIEDGFSQVETIKTGRSKSDSQKQSFKGEVGLSNVFALLKVNFSGDKTNQANETDQQHSSKEKIHTPNSLFSKLRNYLHEKESITTNNFLNGKPGDFVEMQLSLRKNPLIDILDSLSSLMNMWRLLDENNAGQLSKGYQKHSQSKNQNQKILEQLDSLSNQLKTEGSIDLIGTSTNGENFKVVLTLDRAFLTDLSLSDIADGHFSVLGKITRVIQQQDNETVNLLRKTSLSKINRNLLENAFSGFSQLNEYGFQYQDIELEIHPPVIQLIPVAIFT